MEKAIITKNTLFKALKIATAFLAVFIVLSSCEKDKEEKAVINDDNYYVRYVIKGADPRGRFSDWRATTPEGTYTNSGYQTRSWNQTYGPVKKGFKCEVQVGNYISGAPVIEIHVSKNEEPFALKATKSGGSASYTINF